MRMSFMQISEIKIIGSEGYKAEMIKNEAENSLQGKYLGILPKTNILLYPANFIKNNLLNKFKFIDSLSLKDGLRTGLQISVSERQPSAIVCDGFRQDDYLSSGENCFFADKEGYIYEKTDLDKSYNTYYIPNDKENLSPGSYFPNKDKFNELQDFFGGVLKGGLYPLGVLIGENGEYEMYIKNLPSTASSSEVTVYFDDRNSLPATLSNLVSFWQDALLKDKDKQAPAFDYINLRFGNTIYYTKQDN